MHEAYPGESRRRSRRRALLVAGGALTAGALGWLAIGYFGVHTLFIDEKVDEAAPVVVAVPPADQGAIADLANISGSFVPRAHATSGRAEVLMTAEGRVLRFEDFRTDNGPDLNVYLSSAPGTAGDGDLDLDFVDLGDLKGNIGNQNYVIPDGVDLDRYSTVVIWCVRFGVPFGHAELG